VTALARLVASRRLPLAVAGLLVALALLPIEGSAGAAVRAAALLGALAAAGAALRAPAAVRLLAVADRQALGRDSGVALVEAEGRRLLVGYAPQGVHLLAELSGERRP
jgi:flagellar protein FliO/FliZ